MSKVKGRALPNADQYEWIGPEFWMRFHARKTSINLQTITNLRIETLLKQEASYWSQKFRKIEPKAEPKKSDKAEKVFED